MYLKQDNPQLEEGELIPEELHEDYYNYGDQDRTGLDDRTIWKYFQIPRVTNFRRSLRRSFRRPVASQQQQYNLANASYFNPAFQKDLESKQSNDQRKKGANKQTY